MGSIIVGIAALIGFAVGGGIWIIAYHIGWMHGHSQARRDRKTFLIVRRKRVSSASRL